MKTLYLNTNFCELIVFVTCILSYNLYLSLSWDLFFLKENYIHYFHNLFIYLFYLVLIPIRSNILLLEFINLYFRDSIIFKNLKFTRKYNIVEVLLMARSNEW